MCLSNVFCFVAADLEPGSEKQVSAATQAAAGSESDIFICEEARDAPIGEGGVASLLPVEDFILLEHNNTTWMGH